MTDQVKLTDRSLRSVTDALREFGYTTISVEDVRTASDALLRGEEPTEIIGMFVRDMLRDANLLPKPDR